MTEMTEQPDCLMVYDDPFDESCDNPYCEK